jgi:hypothetical protein
MLNSMFVVSTVAVSLLLADAPEFEAFRERQNVEEPGRFTFVRIEYDSVGGYGEAYYNFEGRFWHRWETDYPEAERNLLYRIEELSTIKVNPQPVHLRLTDEALTNYPFVYMCDVGWQYLSNDEVAALRTYLDRGGFLWADDFWGDGEWENFAQQMARAYPKLKWEMIPADHAILKMVFPLEACPQVPAKVFWDTYRTSYDSPFGDGGHRLPTGGIEGVDRVKFQGLFDADRRLLAVATHNSDIGDGWEREGEDVEFFEKFSTQSYAISLNIIVYALTH